MARPREFEENTALDAVVRCFWARGYEATSIRELITATGLSGASLYNAFGDKQALYQRALGHYVKGNIEGRIRRCEKMAPLDAIRTFFAEALGRSLEDSDKKGCMLVNTVFDAALSDEGLRTSVSTVLVRIEMFFCNCIKAGQAEGTIADSNPADDLARHLLGVLMGVRVLARVRPEESLLLGVVAPALAHLAPPPPS